MPDARLYALIKNKGDIGRHDLMEWIIIVYFIKMDIEVRKV